MAKVQQGEPLDMAQLSAVEINSLRAQRDQLREALGRVIDDVEDGYGHLDTKTHRAARAALKATEEG